MLRLKEVDTKLAEIQRIKMWESPNECQRAYIEHLKNLEVAYQRERVYALLRGIDDKTYEDLIPKGMYR